MRPEVVPFAAAHLPAAAALLAERHRRHRLSEPLLGARYEEPAEAAAELEALLAQPGAAGVTLVRGGEPAGYLIGVRRADETWGPNAWVEPAGHAARDAEDARDLYAAAAAAWVREGRTRHYAVVPAADAPLVDAWFRLGFGQQHAIAVAPVPEDASPGTGTREAGAGDVEALAALSPLLDAHQAASPVFSDLPTDDDPAELQREVVELLGEPGRTTYVVEERGTMTGAVYLAPCEASSMHAGLARPERAGLLAWIVVRPEARGGGAGLALTQTAFSWARARGYEALAIDWRATNLLASRFWPRRGFRPTFLRLYRSIP